MLSETLAPNLTTWPSLRKAWSKGAGGAGPSLGGDGVAAIEDDEGSAMVAIVETDIAPDGHNFTALVTPDPVVIRGAGNITV